MTDDPVGPGIDLAGGDRAGHPRSPAALGRPPTGTMTLAATDKGEAVLTDDA